MTTTSNLELEIRQSPLESVPEELQELIDQYPFEQRLNEGLPDPGEQIQWETEQEDFLLALRAHFNGKPVGWLQAHRIHSGGPVWVRLERLQRNRGDLREELLRELKRHLGDEPWVLTHPTQNRTARQELTKFPGVSLTSMRLGFRASPRDLPLDRFSQDPLRFPVLPTPDEGLDNLIPPTTLKQSTVLRPLGPEGKTSLLMSSQGSSDAGELPDKVLVWVPQDHPVSEKIAREHEPLGKRAFFRREPT